jgi:hypothetical protein
MAISHWCKSCIEKLPLYRKVTLRHGFIMWLNNVPLYNIACDIIIGFIRMVVDKIVFVSNLVTALVLRSWLYLL